VVILTQDFNLIYISLGMMELSISFTMWHHREKVTARHIQKGIYIISHRDQRAAWKISHMLLNKYSECSVEYIISFRQSSSPDHKKIFHADYLANT